MTTPDPTSVYVAVIEERHSDTELYVFSTAEAAIAYARRQAEEFAHEPSNIETEEITGWLFYVRWSGEGDCAWVIEKTVDAP